MTIEFRDGDYIKQWSNWNGEIPKTGDYVILHFGDNGEEERLYHVIARVIDGTKPDKIVLGVCKEDIKGEEK